MTNRQSGHHGVGIRLALIFIPITNEEKITMNYKKDNHKENLMIEVTAWAFIAILVYVCATLFL